MTTTEKFLEDVAFVLNVAMPKAEARAEAAGRPLLATERSEVARLVRESLSGNAESLDALKVWTGSPAFPAKPAAPVIGEETDLGRALLAGQHRSPYFAETAPRSAVQITEETDLGRALLESGSHRSPFFAETACTAAQIAEDAPEFSAETSKLATSLPAFQRDEIFGQAMVDFARTVPFGARRLDG
jgi:hypothetical protein